jgi:hypothetical protein
VRTSLHMEAGYGGSQRFLEFVENLLICQCWWSVYDRPNPVPTRYPLRHLGLRPVLLAVILVACGRSTLQLESDGQTSSDSGLPTNDDAGLGTNDDAGLGTKDDAGLGTKEDSGLGTKEDGGLGTKDDAGIGAKDSGAGTEDASTEDAGPGSADSGPDAQDSGPVPGDSGTGDSGPGPQDAGVPGPDAGGILGCFACAEQRCAPTVNACLSSPACVDEGTCDLDCLVGSGKGAGGVSPLSCFQSCVKDQQATQRLFAAVSCAFTMCPKECRGALTSLGGGTASPLVP